MTRLPRRAARGLLLRAGLSAALVAGVGLSSVAHGSTPRATSGDASADAAALAEEPAASPEPEPRPLRVMPLGDSITMGIGSETSSSYRTDLYRRLTDAGLAVDFVGSQRNGVGPDIDHEGHSGWTIAKIAEEVEGWLADSGPDVILLHIGTNDMRSDAKAVGAASRLSSLIDRIRAARPSAQVIVARITGAKNIAEQRRIDVYNAGVRTVVTARNSSRVHLVDQSAVDSLDIRDNLHPNDFGYAKMAFSWFLELRRVLHLTGSTGANPFAATRARLCQLRHEYRAGGYQGYVECRQWHRRTVRIAHGTSVRWQTQRYGTERYRVKVGRKYLMRSRVVLRWSDS